MNDPTTRTFKDYLIPYFSCTFKSALSKEEILNKIRKRTEPEKIFRRRGFFGSTKNSKEYEGSFEDSSFKINRITRKKKSNIPVLLGSLGSSNQYTAVKVKIRLNLMTMIFLPLWIFIIFRSSFTSIEEFQFNEDFNLTTLMPLGIILVFYVIITVTFHSSLKKDFKFLKEVIEPVAGNQARASWIIRN